MLLNHRALEKLIQKEELVTGYIDLDVQLTPNGFDLTCGAIFEFVSAGTLDFSNKEREIPPAKEIFPKKRIPKDKFGWWKLKKGVYKVKTNETVNLPKHLVALAFSRTSLLRMGAFTQHGVWDAGFRGKGEFILVVENPAGIKIKANARIAQLVFYGIEKTKHGYQGIFQDLK